MTNPLTAQDLHDSHALLMELFEEVRSLEGTLAGGGMKLGPGASAVQQIYESRADFGNPRDKLIRLTSKDFGTIGVELTEIYKRQMRDQFDFYYMTLPLMIRLKRGTHLKRLECQLDFGPKGVDEPIVQRMFPTSEWREILRLGIGMNLALNGNLDWKAEIDTSTLPKTINLPGKVQASVANKGNLNAFIVVPEYSFDLGRVEVSTSGEGNSECYWCIEKPRLKGRQDVLFGVVFKVPKGTDSILLTGLPAAAVDVFWLIDKIRDVYEHLSNKFQVLFNRGEDSQVALFIGQPEPEQWEIKLPR